MLEALVIAKMTKVVVPEVGALPVPAQPLQEYWIPVEPCVGEVTYSVMLVPLSNQPVDGEGESWGDVMEK
jgi:hypothetical protein